MKQYSPSEIHNIFMNALHDNKPVNLSHADLHGIRLTGKSTNALNYSLYGAQLIGARLTNADLSGANLTDADLTYADLSGAVLSGTNLTGAKLAYASLKDIVYDEKTKWPTDFVPPPSLV